MRLIFVDVCSRVHVNRGKREEIPLRIITAAAIFDGHDAAIGIFRRIFQSMGCEVIHLGHDRGANDVAKAAIQEDAHCIAITSYQGGAVEMFTHTKQILDDSGFGHVCLVGGGGGTILPSEIQHLFDSDIAKIYSPEDGRELGLTGMVSDAMKRASDNDLLNPKRFESLKKPIFADEHSAVSKLLTLAENEDEEKFNNILDKVRSTDGLKCPVIGLTGTGGAGKSSLTDELMLRIQRDNPGTKIALLATDPTRKRTGGALLGDRIRMNSLSDDNLFMRSFASRNSGREIADCIGRSIEVCKAVGFDLVIVETSGIGQGNDAITEVADISLYVTTREYGAPSQLEKLEMLDSADIVVLNKFDRPGAEDALLEIQKQFKRNREIWDTDNSNLPVVPTIASQFADAGVDQLWKKLSILINDKYSSTFSAAEPRLGADGLPHRSSPIPSERQGYLAEVSNVIKNYHLSTEKIASKMRLLQQLESAAKQMKLNKNKGVFEDLMQEAEVIRSEIPDSAWESLQTFSNKANQYRSGTTSYTVRDKDIAVETTRKTLSGLDIPRVALPEYSDWGDTFSWIRRENIPGSFPYTGGVFPFKRQDELPVRMFAGEGSAERTNKRYHFLSKDQDFNRLSVAFDSPSLYGNDPQERLDIFGKVCESGVSISTIDEMEKLFEGFDLCASNTSVSKTINGNYWWHLAAFFNVAIRQQIKKFERENGRQPNEKEHTEIKSKTLRSVRGTVQADQLKESMGQNTLVFNLDTALRMMGDVAEFYVDNEVRNHYFVSISGYHIAEAGANPISQAALTLSNGLTYVELFNSRGLNADKFLRNFSWFFSNGMDPEYAVIGRVCRRIWSIAMRDMYGVSERGQKLKYHIQSSGRSLHAQEYTWNDYRTTLQALYALADNANSLHTNSRDEAFGTPTEDTVRDAVAIQLILSKEYGWLQNENPLQGSHVADWLTDSVEEEILKIFEEMNRRGGVLGALEVNYQRNRIQDESMIYEHRKHSGELPIIGVNTFKDDTDNSLSIEGFDVEVTRSDKSERMMVIERNIAFKKVHLKESREGLARLKKVAREGGNLFEVMMDIVNYCTVGQVTQALFETGGKFRRNM
ncbi:MAG: methylmalonyl-CoA mutase [Marine Group II euryarchaeote MED-G38]|nr:methylmalonyl-CoA mutase [Euryarchaeota archaeon]OUV27800.1 MAG: methylmalonyl-CoA mutase [Euryarchaeota archaeon TMED97]PDH23599.1 MAG: methylmalonyl-CoA mutase [Marine Group II euryarchaeote MED-G38]|tara:strand:- start:3732 stop:7028 length:3297 start_codon:yes stop_codon:yes gene_type:complete